MKKSILFGFILVLGFSFVACQNLTTDVTTDATTTTAAATTVEQTTTVAETTTNEITTVETTTADTVGPVISGADDITVYLDTTFDPYEGVTATDNVDGDLTSSITYVGVFDTSSTGTYFLKYSVTDNAGNKTEVSRYVTVEVDPSLIGDELVQNGDFALGWAIWGFTQGNEGGYGTPTVVDGALQVAVTGTSGENNPFEPRLESNVIEFENGTTYEVTFDAKALAPRSINVQVGQLLSASPWFVNYKTGQAEIFDLTTDWVTYSFKFTMNQDEEVGALLEGQLLFEMGAVVGEIGTDNLLTTVFYDNVMIEVSTADPDTTAPTISGANDATVETDSDFDPLSGVSAFDIVDGDVTDSIVVTGSVDTSTGGEYTLTYTVSDAAGNETSVTRVITVVSLVFNDTADVTDGAFDTTTEIIAEVQDEGYNDITDPEIWYQYTADWDGAAATFSVVNNAAVVEVSAAGNEVWGVMLKQNGINLELGKTYKLSFTASSTVERDIYARVTDDYEGIFTINDTAATYEFIFTYDGSSRTDATLMFLLGNTAAYAASTVTIDDVILYELEQDVLVTNGDFESNGWSMWLQNWDEGAGLADASMAIVDGELVVTTTNLSSYNWSIQLFQEGLAVENGTTYVITFDAMADVARDINLKFIDANGTEFPLVVSLTTTMDTYTLNFEYTGSATTGKIDFELGLINSATAGTITFDNITMSVVGGDALTVVNGGFDQVVGWGTWSASGDTTIAIVDGQLEVNVPNIGSNFYESQLFQEGISVSSGNVYSITFDAMADVARDFSVVFIDANGAEFRETLNLTTDLQTFTFTFLYDGTASSGKLDFEFGNISEASAVAVITIDNLAMYRSLNPYTAPEAPAEEVWVAYGMTLEETETEKTITYGTVPASWWDINVQGTLPSFMGQYDQITFSFMGEAGQDYLFKIQSDTVNAEVAVTATGSAQEVTLDLSGMTEAERDGLNLIIIFAQTLDATGTLHFYGWDYVIPLTTTWVGYGMTLVETETELTITYGAVPASWWDINAQGTLSTFDGSYDAITFTFMGEAGQDYLFKIEGGGVSAELGATATGSVQELTLDLSGMTEAERDGLNLIILFAQTLDGTGDLVLYGWDYVVPTT